MGRLVNTEGVGKQRDRLTKAVALALRELASHQKPDARARDLVAFMSLALAQVDETIDETCRAWEKRDYWIKADQFRSQWAWAKPLSERLALIALQDKWAELGHVMPDLFGRLSHVNLPKRNGLGEPWVGAFEKLRSKAPEVDPPPPEVTLSEWRPKKIKSK